MSAAPGKDVGADGGLPLAPRLQQLHRSIRTKRAAELETLVAKLQGALREAEAELEWERTRPPVPGEFVRCPLTNFFGKVTKVIPRPHGRPWVEIIPYLGKDLPGHDPMDLFDSWERIDSPTEAPDEGRKAEAPSEGRKAEPPTADNHPARLPSVSAFAPLGKPLGHQQRAGEIEPIMGDLWTLPDRNTP